MDVDRMDCTEFFTIVVLTVLVNFFHLNFILDNMHFCSCCCSVLLMANSFINYCKINIFIQNRDYNRKLAVCCLHRSVVLVIICTRSGS